MSLGYVATPHPPEGAYCTIIGSRVMFMLSALKPAMAVMMEVHTAGVCLHSWPKMSAVARREGRNSDTPSRVKSCRAAGWKGNGRGRGR
jgi:hypothetical protein